MKLPPIPPPRVERVGDIWVVRDDELPGGTKRRVLGAEIAGATEAVYASPVFGYAQIALAYAAADLGIQATVFVAKRATLHPRTLEAMRAGARVIQVPVGYLAVVQARARAYCDLTGAKLVPFGVDTPSFQNAISGVARAMNIEAPREVWSVAGSGALSRALQEAWPKAKFHAVQIGRTPSAGRATVHLAPEKFEQDAKNPPPFRSCSNYDAKAWRFIKERASKGALFWNVAA